jgi:tRNA G46 methylase TrmB
MKIKSINLIQYREFEELHLDIGCGTGAFLVAAAAQHHRNYYIGVDVNSKSVEKTQKYIDNKNIKNAECHLEEAEYFINKKIRENSVDGIHVYFPTPYIKPLNQSENVHFRIKHKVLNHSFLERCKYILKEGGTLRIVSDHERYIHDSRNFAMDVGFIQVPWLDHIRPNNTIEIVGTGCEKEMLKNGKNIYSLMFME